MVRQYYKQILAAVLIVFFVAAGVLSVATASIRGYTQSVNQKTLNQVKEVIDTRVEEAHNIAFQLYTSQRLVALKNADDIFSKNDITKTLEYQWNLENFNFYNRYVTLNFTLFPQNGYVVMPRSGQDLASFSRQFASEKFLGGFSSEGFLQMLEQTDSTFAEKISFTPVASGLSKEVLPYVKWLKSTGSRHAVAVVLLLDATAISELLSQSLTPGRSLLCILDASNRVVVSSREMGPEEYALVTQAQEEQPLGTDVGDDLSVYGLNASEMPWRYVLLADQRESVQALDNLFGLIVVICGACFAIAIGVSLAIIRRNQTILRPIFEMTGASGPKDRRDVHQALGQSVRRMMEDKTRLDQKLKEQDAVLREVHLNNLLKGDCSDLEALSLPEFAQPNGECFYFVAVAAIRALPGGVLEDGSVQKIKSVIGESIKLFGKSILSCNISRLETALIVAADSRQPEGQHREYIELLYEFLGPILKKDYNAGLTLSVGGLHAGGNAIPVSFAEARLNRGVPSVGEQAGVTWFAPVEHGEGSYYYPPETEIQLINAIRAGNRPLVEHIVKDLFDVNLVEKQIGYAFLTVFLHDFYGSVLKVVKAGSTESPIQKEIYDYYARNIRNIDSMEFQQKFLNYVYALTDSFNSSKKSHNELLIEKITAFVKDNYADYSLTLYRVADEFHLSSGYLSAFFKEQTGGNFSEFVTRTKMERAGELVKHTARPINEIAEATGYGSSNTFCRAFRKHFGVSPMELRDAQNGRKP